MLPCPQRLKAISMHSGSAAGPGERLRCSGDVPRNSATLTATQRDLCARGRRRDVGVSLDVAGTGGTAQRRADAILGDEVKSLGGIERRGAWLPHYYNLHMLLNGNYSQFGGAGPPFAFRTDKQTF